MVEQLKSCLKNGEAALIMSEENISYFTSFHSSNGYLVVTKDKSFFLTDSRYIEAAGNTIKSCDEILLLKSLQSDLVNLIDSLDINEIMLESERTTVSRYNKIKELLPDITVSAAGDLDNYIDEIRITKNKKEFSKIIKAQRIAERAFDHILSFISTEKTEKEIALELDYFMLKNGADALSFETISVSGKNSSMPHGVPSDKKIENGDFITMDFGAIFDFYHSDMTRTVAVGEVSTKQIEVYETVLTAQLEAIAKIKAGAVCRDVDKVARDIITSKGYSECFGHGLGHGVGVEIHESPSLNPTSSYVLKTGNIVTVEPGIYIPGEFGVRIEDMGAVTENGFENFTLSEKKLIVL
ncbi:MAG: aminopeptidase P family protein [Ruminococcaceae bacterium]|nr:aminopeptidase P family protein [Oscillospiraceae bacterium]